MNCETVIDPNEKVMFLVSQPNIDVNCVSSKGQSTPLHIAVKKRKVDVTNSKDSTPYDTGPHRIRKIFDGILPDS